jgi:hypothetical protein
MATDPARLLLSLLYRLRFYFSAPSDFVLTGIPRSGTSLLSALLCEPDDCFCFNEIHYDPRTLPYFFTRMRRRLVTGRPVPVKLDDAGALTTDTMGGQVQVQEKSFPATKRGVVIGSNVNVPYLDRIDEILAYGYRVLMLVRDPVYTLASWNSEKAQVIPEAHVTDEDMNPRWHHMRFDSVEREDRQADIWEHYARLIWSLRDRFRIFSYESLTDAQETAMQEIYRYLGVTPPQETRQLRSMNIDSRFSGLERIREAVSDRCPSRHNFGY